MKTKLKWAFFKYPIFIIGYNPNFISLFKVMAFHTLVVYTTMF